MNLKILVAVALLIPLGITAPASAENPAHVKQLLETGLCQGCDLQGANLRAAHLIGADLRDANLRGAILENANLEGADLTGASLEGANLKGAFLNSAALTATNLTNAVLTDANLISADLVSANLTATNLQGANLVMASVSEVQLAVSASAFELRGTAERNALTDTPLGIGGEFPSAAPGYTQEDLNLVFPPLEANPNRNASPGTVNQDRGVNLWNW